MIHAAYEEYTETGLPWLPEIPKEWEVVNLRRGIDFLTDFEANGSFADVKKNVELDTDEKYAWYLRATDLQNNRVGISDEVRTCDKKAYDYLAKTRLYGGEFLVAKRGEVGKIYVVPELPCKATLAPNLYLIRLNEKLNTKFTYYWYSSSYGKPELFLANKSTTIGALYKDDVRACKILLPSVYEQEKIANFLDHETAQIDTLIEKQQHLIKLLKEKRQAVISHAVTKGLNPNAPMRESGVEWLGEVPEHWETMRLKYQVEMLPGYAFKSAGFVDSSEEINLLRGINIAPGNVRWDEAVYWPSHNNDDLTEYVLQEKDLVLGMDRPWVGGGLRLAMLSNEDLPAYVVQRVARIRGVQDVSQEYLFDLLSAPGFSSYFDPITTGVSVPHISTDQIGEYYFALPP
ncbi:hypothetical protein A9Q78_06485, partial [Methylophaga sp. 41_12_T18]